MTASDDVVRALRPVVQWLDRHGIGYRIGGSLASSIHGVARSTLDVDLVVDFPLAYAPAFAADLTSEYYVDATLIEDAVRRSAAFNVIHLETMVKLDLFVLGPGAYDHEAFGRGQRAVLPGARQEETFGVIAAEDIVLRKLEWYRKGGEVSERQWGDVCGVLRIQGASLDRAYLERWAAALGIADLLERALQESWE